MSNNKQSITIQGRTFPCRQTMGAFLRYKRETGREATDMQGNMTDMLTFLYCCIVSACQADGMAFQWLEASGTPHDYTLIDFADRVTVDDINQWTEHMQAASAEAKANEGEQKKSLSAS